MPTEAALADVAAELAAAGKNLPERVARQVRCRGAAAIPGLIRVLEDAALARADAPGGGYVPVHAAALLGEMGSAEAIEPMLRILGRTDPESILHGALVSALPTLGRPVLGPALRAHAEARTEEERTSVATVLSGLRLEDDRVLAVLLRTLEEEPVLGAGMLAEYGDPRAIAHLKAALDRCEPDDRGGLLANQDVVEIEAAIDELGGTLSEAQMAKVEAVAAAREEAGAALLAIGAAGDDDEDGDEGEGERREIVRRFAASRHASEALDPGWVAAALEYGAAYQDASLADFDAGVLRRVVFDDFPRKVSCESSAAGEIIHSLRAFWTFARDVLAHPQAEACLRELGEEAIPRLARRLEDPSLFGMAKSFVMGAAGVARGVLDGTGWAAGRASRGSEASKRKRRLRKLKKRAQRRNRR